MKGEFHVIFCLAAILAVRRVGRDVVLQRNWTSWYSCKAYRKGVYSDTFSTTHLT